MHIFIYTQDMENTKTVRLTQRILNQFGKEILAGCLPGTTMAQADPYGAMLQKKIATWQKAQVTA